MLVLEIDGRRTQFGAHSNQDGTYCGWYQLLYGEDEPCYDGSGFCRNTHDRPEAAIHEAVAFLLMYEEELHRSWQSWYETQG